MVSELRDVRDFLAGHPPFAALPEAALDLLPRRVSVRYLRRGAGFPPANEAAPGAFYVLRKGAVELRDRSEALVDKLGEGDGFDATDQDTPEAAIRGTVVEDTLLYSIPAEVLAELCREHPGFGSSFAASIVQRLRRAQHAVPGAVPAGGNLLRLEVGDLLSRDPVTAPADLALQDAAVLMTRERVSSLLVVEDGRLAGIVTDRDLRTRCVARGLPVTAPLREVMTERPHTVDRRASAFEALMTMSRLAIHHLPVADADGVHGLVSTHDLLRAQATNPLYLADRVGRSHSVDELRVVVEESRELHRQLVASHATSRQLGQAVTSVCDAVTRRLLEFALDELGPPPVPFAWIATGSQGRGELSLRSDQDNCLILEDSFTPQRHRPYFEALAKSVNVGLDVCGYVSCPGDVMASNARWRQPSAVWAQYFSDWLKRTDRNAAALAVNFLDMRTVWGEDALRRQLMAQVLPACAREAVFLGYLAAHALGNQPPLGFFRSFVLARTGAHERTVDLKVGGLLPIVDLARIFALAQGVEAVGTLQRLEDAAGEGGLTQDGAETLQAAFEFIWQLRARHHVGQLLRGEPVSNLVAPAALSAGERRSLKDAFAAVATMQRALRTAYGDRLPL